jgi:plastocyanin
MKKLFALSALALAAAALVACGGSSDSSSTSNTATPGGTAKGGTGKSSAAGGGAKGASGGGGGATVKVAADPSGQLKFDTTKLTAKAGSDTFDFTNDAPISHNFTIEDSSGNSVAATPTFAGGSKSVTANLKPGTYKFVCTVPGHAQAGMQGTLTVK